jgi:hypothetical protein
VFGPEPVESLDAALERLDRLVESFETDPDPGIQIRGLDLLQAVDAVHRLGLTRLATYLDKLDPSARARALDDPAVRTLLELYDLLPPQAPREPGFVPLGQLKIVRAARSRG